MRSCCHGTSSWHGVLIWSCCLPRYETKGKLLLVLLLSGFYGNSTQEHFFGYLWVPWHCSESYERVIEMTDPGRRCSNEAVGSGGVSGPSQEERQLSILETGQSCYMTKKINNTLVCTVNVRLYTYLVWRFPLCPVLLEHKQQLNNH